MSATDDFFEERTDQSEVKTRIVTKFFASWSNVIVQTAKRSGRKPRLAYIDLFAGPGTYGDGSKSTPLLIMEKAIQTPALAEGLSTIFNDADPDHAASLRAAIETLPGFSEIKIAPHFLCDEVDAEFEQLFSQKKLVPTLSFIDPFGYKGVTAKLIRALAKDWGSDCVFFFNYRRINSAITNDCFRPHMDALFGADRVERMRGAVVGMKPWQRLDYTLGMVAEALAERGFGYSLPFLFKNETGARTTHALIYVTKHPLGFTIMKEIMAAESSTADYGVPSYIYCPADAVKPPQLDLSSPIRDLADQLARDYAGSRVRVEELITREDPKTRFLKKNYRDAILQLEETGRLQAEPPAAKRPPKYGRPTCGPNVVLIFPPKARA